MIYTLDPLKDPRWTAFVETHPRATIFHTAGWLDALRRTYEYQPVVYTTSAPSHPLSNGVPLCRIRSWITGRKLVSLPFTDHCQPLVANADERQSLAGALCTTSKNDNLRYVELRPLTAEGWDGHGFSKSSEYVYHALDLRPKSDAIFGAFHRHGIQRKIGRAQREGVTVDAGTDEVHMEAFYDLMVQTRRRHGRPPQPIEWFRNLRTCLGTAMTIRVARHAGQPIAAMMTLLRSTTLVYKYGCSDARVHNLGAMPFLFWTAIEAAKLDGVQTFDLGRSDASNVGLTTFKERLGAARSSLIYARYPALQQAGGSRTGVTTRLRYAVVQRLPRTLLIASGRLLYRHFA